MIALLVALALAPPQFVALDQVDSTIVQDMRYATAYNFVGRRIKGYREPVCILTRPAARALRRAQKRLRPKGYGLKVYDCYRPTRAVAQFSRWAARAGDEKMKREFYPRTDKRRLFDLGYIAGPAIRAAAPSTSRSSGCRPGRSGTGTASCAPAPPATASGSATAA